MGGGGFLGLGPAPSAPAAPDYRGAAKETADSNFKAAQAATAANRVNQVTPYGNLDYAESGTDSQGNPTWTATTSLSPTQQALLDMQNQASLGLGSAINAQLGLVQDTMGKGFNPNIPKTQTGLGENYRQNVDYEGGMQGWDKANALLMQRLQPQMEIQQKTLDAKLANQGIVQGTEAYNRAKMGLGLQQNDLLNQSQLTGLQAGNTLFQQGLQGAGFTNQAALQQGQFGNQAQQQAYNQALTNYNLPLNTLSALRTGAQVQNPTFQNAPQQATTGGADILGAANANYNAQMGGFNAQQAAQANMNSGLMGLGGTLGAAAMMSDIRTKENITQVYWLPNGLPVYTYEYKPEYKDEAGHGVHIGVMAQEVEQVMPEAVITRDDGIKMVDYGVLNA
jgi:hypothetical protein